MAGGGNPMWPLTPFAGRLAAISETGQFTYAELARESAQLAALVPGRSLVFQLCTNTLGSLLGYAGFLNHRIVPALLSADVKPDVLTELSTAYRPSFLWIPAQKMGQFAGKAIWESHGYMLLKTGAASPDLYEDLGLLLTTSGSTGSPKLVRQSYDNIRSNAAAIVEYLGITANERPITTLPMSYTYGLSIINSHLLQGATLLLTDKGLMQREFWEFFKQHGATSFGGVPYTYEILKKLRVFRMELPSLKTMTQAGGKLSPELHREFAEFAHATGRRFIVMYGQTEATARMAYLPPEQAMEKCGSMGLPIPGGRFELVDEVGARIEGPDVPGELVYHGPNVALGYAERGEDLAQGDEWGGVLATGDMARRDADGFYYVVGRKKRFLKIFGNRVNLDETERMLKDRFDGLECACAGVDDRMTVYLAEAARAREVLDFLAAKTGLNPIAFAAKSVPGIPKNEAGKTLYAELEKLG